MIVVSLKGGSDLQGSSSAQTVITATPVGALLSTVVPCATEARIYVQGKPLGGITHGRVNLNCQHLYCITCIQVALFALAGTHASVAQFTATSHTTHSCRAIPSGSALSPN